MCHSEFLIIRSLRKCPSIWLALYIFQFLSVDIAATLFAHLVSAGRMVAGIILLEAREKLFIIP